MLFVRHIAAIAYLACASTAYAQHNPIMCPTVHKDWAAYIKSKQLDPKIAHAISTGQEELPGLKVLYKLQPDNTFKISDEVVGGDTNEFVGTTEIWSDLQMLSKEPIGRFFASVAIYDHTERTKDAPMAFVTPAGSKYHLSIDIGVAKTRDWWDYTLIHEFGHVMLGTTFHPPMFRLVPMLPGTMVTLPRYDPLTLAYQQAFWSDCNSVALQRTRHSFLTFHAMKNIDEDLAETWVGFIVCDKPTDNDVRVVAQKKRMMWNNADLLARREHIHETFGAERLAAIRNAFGWWSGGHWLCSVQ